MTTTEELTGANLTMQVLDRHVELALWAESEHALGYLARYLAAQVEADRRVGKVAELEEKVRPSLTTFTEALAGNSPLAPGDISRIIAAQDSDVPNDWVFAYAENLQRQMGLAETYWVAPDMVDLIDQAAPTIEHMPLRAHHVPYEHGFVQFARTLHLGVDRADEPWGVIGFSWSIAETVWYSEEDVEESGTPGEEGYSKIARSEEHHAPGLSITWWLPTADFEERRNRDEPFDPDVPWAFVGQITGWSFDLPWENEGRVDETGALQRQIILATFNLLNDEIVRVWQDKAPRGARRRAARVLRTPEPGDVRIVDLRKTRVIGKPDPEDEGDGETIMWTHRWVVRGHWRTLYRGNRHKEKQVWVRSHVKGPEGKKIIYKDRLSRLVR